MSGGVLWTLPRRLVSRRPHLSGFRRPLRESRISSPVSYSNISASNIEYQYIEDVEDLGSYRPGGYHPIQIDDRLHNRYRIVHKLGHGTFSTAWLAVDEQISKYVAVKVGIADADRREADVLSELRKGILDASYCVDNTASMIPLTLDRFHLDGPNGTHPCLVTVPARYSLIDAKEASGPRLLQLDVTRSLAAQLAIAVSLIHSQGYAHGGMRSEYFLPIIL